MMMCRLAWLLPILALAQRPAAPPRRIVNPIVMISGQVVDAGRGQPIQGASVFVRCLSGYSRADERTILTNLNGQFANRFINEEGCVVSVRAEGYLESPEDAERSPVKIPPASEGQPKPLRFAFYREAEISGSVIDRQSGKPVSGLTVWAQRSGFERGKRRLRATADAATSNAEGKFEIRRLPPGKYFLRVTQREQERIENRRLPPAVVSGYPRTFWPGGADEAAVPLYVSPEAHLFAGAIFVEKARLFRATAVIDSPACTEGRKYKTVLWQQQGPEFIARASDTLRCGAPFTVHNLTPGVWWLESRLESTDGRDADSVVERFEIKEKDLSVVLAPLPTLMIALKVIAKDPRTRTGCEAALHPAGWPSFLPPEPQKIEGGAALLPAPAAERARLAFSGLGESRGVLSIRYNGGTVDDETFTVNRAAPTQVIEVELTDKPPVLAGTVKNSDRAAPGALVVAAPWPAALQAEWPLTYRALADQAGAFQFPPVSPGEYRVFAMDAGLRERLEEPGVLLRAIGRGDLATLRVGERTAINLKLSEP